MSFSKELVFILTHFFKPTNLIFSLQIKKHLFKKIKDLQVQVYKIYKKSKYSCNEKCCFNRCHCLTFDAVDLKV